MTPNAPPLRAAQIVVGGLVAGLVVISVASVVLRIAQPPREPTTISTGALLLVVVLMFATSVAAWLVLRRRFLAQVAENREAALAVLRQDCLPLPLYMITILGCVLVEAPGLLGVVTLFLGGPWYVLLAPAASIALMVRQFPTRERCEELVRHGA